MTKKQKQKKEKRIKAWAIYNDVRLGCVCSASDEAYDAWYYMIFDEEKEAIKALFKEGNPKNWKIIPCTIIIHPTK